jgi:phosphoheptose isomerase
MSNLPLENIESKFYELCKLPEWSQIKNNFKKADDVYVIGNGGNFAVASHAATDASRLLDKCVTTLDSPSMMTSSANDWGYDSIFTRWLEAYSGRMRENSMIIGLSSSGNSKNVVDALNWGIDSGHRSALISGQPSKALGGESDITELVCDCDYFHTHEILCLMLFYELIDSCGGRCPSILDEVSRKSKEPLPLVIK